MKMKIIMQCSYVIKLINLDVDMDNNIPNIACLGKMMSMCNKQYLSNI